MISFASHSSTKCEHQYSVIQKEYLAVVYATKHATKQFRHYLLGRHSQLVTDHAPLQWLSSQKMEGLLCRWTLALQVYNFTIVYHKGLLNSNADALSRLGQTEAKTAQAVITIASISPVELHTAQQEDEVTREISKALSQSCQRPRTSA